MYSGATLNKKKKTVLKRTDWVSSSSVILNAVQTKSEKRIKTLLCCFSKTVKLDGLENDGKNSG